MTRAVDGLPVFPASARGYYVVMDGDCVLLDNGGYCALRDCCDAQRPRPIATFTTYVAAQRASRRINWQAQRGDDPARPKVGAIPVWVEVGP